MRWVHEAAGSVVGAIGEQMLDPGPALADGIEDRLRPCAVGDIGRGQVDHQEAAIGIDRDMPLAADRLLGGVVAALGAQRRRLHRLAVDHAGARAGLAAGTLAVHHPSKESSGPAKDGGPGSLGNLHTHRCGHENIMFSQQDLRGLHEQKSKRAEELV